MTVLLLLISLNIFARVNHDNQSWINLNSQFHFKNSLLYTEFQPRMIENNETMGVKIHRIAYLKKLNQLMIGAGYAYVVFERPVQFYEHRPYLETRHNEEFDWFQFYQRIRFEGRFLEERAGVAWRGRYFVRIIKTYKNLHNFGFSIWNEYFWQTNSINDSRIKKSSHPKAGFDQNRFFIGAIKRLGNKNEHFFELGHMWMYVNGRANDTFIKAFVAQLALNF